MKVEVKLYGTLAQHFLDCLPSQGMEVELPDGVTVKGLLALLEIPESQRAVVIVEGRILKADDQLRDGVPVSIMQAVGGG
jgi:molybdopterin synthase sulfur carrier subunit